MAKFDKYLDEIGITSPVQERINKIISEYELIIDREIEDIFVSEYVNTEGSRELLSLNLFTSEFLMEAKSFVNRDDFDITPIKSRICYLQMEKNDYDLHESKNKSRLIIELGFVNQVTGTLQASSNNCPHLLRIAKRYLLNNVDR